MKQVHYYLIEEDHIKKKITILKHFTDKYNGLHEIEHLSESYIKEKHSEIDIKYYVTNDLNIPNYYFIKKTRLNGVTVCKNTDVKHKKVISLYLTDCCYIEEPEIIYSYLDNLRYDLFEFHEEFNKVLYELKYKKDLKIFKQYDIVMKQLKKVVDLFDDRYLVFNMDD